MCSTRTSRVLGRVGVVLAAGALAASMMALTGGTAWGATTSVNCPPGNLQDAIYHAHPGDTIVIHGTCVGNFIVDRSLTLSGGILDGNHSGSVLFIDGRINVTLTGLTVQHGLASHGPGIWNNGTLTLNNTIVSNNTGVSQGSDAAGIENEGPLTLNNSIVASNSAPGASFGGGIENLAPLTLNSSRVSNNSAGTGGGIYNDSTVSLQNSRVDDNTASGDGGGIYNDGGTFHLQGSSVTNNNAGGDGGGIDNDDNFGNVTPVNSSVSMNTPDDCDGC